MRKPKVGDKLFSLNIGNAARRTKQELTPVIVVKVGRKYFTVSPIGKEHYEHLAIQYYIDTWKEKTDYSASSVLYETEKEWNDKREISVISTQIHSHFSSGRCHIKISIDDIRKIKSILDKYNKQER
jgi:hypothetical protein